MGSRAAQGSQSGKERARCGWIGKKAFDKGPFNFTADSTASKKILKNFLFVLIQSVKAGFKDNRK